MEGFPHPCHGLARDFPGAPGAVEQDVVRYTRHGEDVQEERLMPVRFVPLLPGIAREAVG